MVLGCPLTIARSEIRQYLGTSAISAGETCFGYRGSSPIFLEVFLELRSAN
jgi:hypothetical protein